LWPSFAAPAVIWLAVLFVLPFYVIVSIAFGTVDPIFRSPLPVWEPWFWSADILSGVLHAAVGHQRAVYVRTVEYVAISSALCILIGYGVAYYVARFSGKRKNLYLAVLIAPFFISYLMRMLAWINLLEAARDLGANRIRTFMRVTAPLSRPAMFAGVMIVSLPMFGDYYTNNLLSGSPKTTMLGNLLDNSVQSTGQGPQAAAFALVIIVLLLIPMFYYLRTTYRAQGQG
jgi:ABC-type spermidine/putrescine transport system permease subunit I